nr:pyrroline-5-carboxylate reductase [Polymorphobacter multimanifer]
MGCGNMGGALLGRWIAAGTGPWRVIDPAKADAPDGAVRGAGDDDPAVVVLAVKPQVWREVVAPLAGRVAGAVVISVMAGVTAAALAEALPGARIVRAMPNTPAAIGQGVTGLWSADAGARDVAGALFEAAGAVVWLEDEADFDALTGVSGSGPAYVFGFIEALAAAGCAAGLSDDVAMALARGTVTGAAALAANDPAAADELRRRVTSPGGTTAAGLAVLMPGLGPLLVDTVAAAAARSKSLGGE